MLGYGATVGFFAGFSFIPPLGKTAAWTVAVGPFSQTRDTGPLRLIVGSLTFPQKGALTAVRSPKSKVLEDYTSVMNNY